jgi:putative endonuclease
MTKDELGKWGEDFATNFLLQNGYSLIERNVRFKKYEVDIIAEKDDELIVVEVKARITAEIGEPWRAVTKSKQRQIITVADYYVQKNQIDKNVRFDIISIVHNNYRTNLEHIIGAFDTLK